MATNNVANIISNPALDKLIARKQLSMLAALMCERDAEYAAMADEVALCTATRRARVKATLESLQESSGAPKGKGKAKGKSNGKRAPKADTSTPTVNVAPVS